MEECSLGLLPGWFVLILSLAVAVAMLRTCTYSLFSQSLLEGVSWHTASPTRGLDVSASHTGLSRTDCFSCAARFPASLLART